MRVEPLGLAGVVVMTAERQADARGFLSVSWNREQFAAATGGGDVVQENHSFSARRGTVRGLHCQVAPHAQGKLIRVVRGAIWDVAVDIRRTSATFGQHVSVELSASSSRQLWIPVGFLHGFCTLEDATEVIYKLTAVHDRAAERGVIWTDPSLAIAWPVTPTEAILSERDRALPGLAAARDWFPD